MMKFVYIFLFIFFFDNVSTTWCQNPYPWMQRQLKTWASSNGSLQFIEAEPLNGERVDHFAAYLSVRDPEPVLYGAMATIDVYESLNVEVDQSVIAGIWVGNYQLGHLDSANVLQAGWMIQPSYYGDKKAHFYTYWTADGYNSTGCGDLKCMGFIPSKDAPVMPGDILKGNRQISIKISKAGCQLSYKASNSFDQSKSWILCAYVLHTKYDDDWWLEVAMNGYDFSEVGYWPRNLFKNLAAHANHVSWGGYTGSLSGTRSPPMGNGQWPGKQSATFQDVQFLDNEGSSYGVFPTPGIRPLITHKKCYQVSEFMSVKFAYGGPGGC